MKRTTSLLVSAALLTLSTTSALAIDPGSVIGLSPEQVMQLYQSEQASDMLLLEAIKERNRQIEYQQRQQQQNPFAGCESMGEVRGKDFEEMKTLSIKMGATNYRLIETTSSYVRANIYKCPQKQ